MMARSETRKKEIAIRDDMRFQPSRVTVKRNEMIRFVVKNEGKTKQEMVLGTMAELKENAALMRKFPEMEHDDPNAVKRWHRAKAARLRGNSPGRADSISRALCRGVSRPG